MSHPIPGHEYNQNKRNKGLTPSQLKSYSHKIMKNEGVVTRAKHEALIKKKGKNIPKYGRYGNERPGMSGQSAHLPPGYKQSDLE